MSDIFISNCLNNELKDIAEKIHARDLHQEN